MTEQDRIGLYLNIEFDIKHFRAPQEQKERAMALLEAASEPSCDDVFGVLSMIPAALKRDRKPLSKSEVSHRLARILLRRSGIDKAREQFLEDLAFVDEPVEVVLRARREARSLLDGTAEPEFYDACCLALFSEEEGEG